MNAMNEMPSPLVFTDAAAAKVKTLIDEEGNPDLKLRVFVSGGGCSGFQYGFTFDEVVNEDDTAMEKDGVTLLIDPMSYQYLVGAEIDYQEGLEGAQFVIKNPNAQIDLRLRLELLGLTRSSRPRKGRPRAPFALPGSLTVSARINRAEHARPLARAGDRRQVARPPGKRLAREPRERQRLDLLDRHAFVGGRRQPARRELGARASRHQRRVVARRRRTRGPRSASGA